MREPYYQDDSVTLYHGDCREVDAWLTADVLVTDPPYGIRLRQRRGSYGSGREARVFDAVANDLSTDVRDTVLRMWGDRPRIVFGHWRTRPAEVDHRLIWHKAGQAPGPLNAAFMSQDEEIYVSGTGFRRTSPPLRSVITTNESRSCEVAKIGHPTPKPIGLMELLIGRCPAGTVADPFAGSGSTLVAAAHLGRKSIGVELEERYCDLIARRLAQGAFDFEAMAE